MVPYIDIGMDVSGDEGKFVIAGQIILSLPGYSCMRCMGFLNENVLAKEANNYGATGGKPQVVWPNGVLASVAVMQFMNLITPWQNNDHPALYLDYDGNRSTVTPNNRLHCIKTESCKHFQGGVALGEVSW